MTPELWTTIAIAIISLFSAVGGGIIVKMLPLERKKTVADIIKTKAEADLLYAERQKLFHTEYSEIIEELREHIDYFEKRLDKQEANAALQFKSQQTIIDDFKERLFDTERRLRDAEAKLKNAEDREKKLTERVEVLEAEKTKLVAERDRLLAVLEKLEYDS